MHVFISDQPEIEYLAGRAVPKVSPKHRHAVVQISMASILRREAEGRGTVGTEWRFRLNEGRNKTQLVPDVAFVSYERWRPLPDEERQEPPFAPDIAVEIRSSGDKLSDVLWKLRAYLDAGTLLAFDIRPESRSMVVYAQDGTRELSISDTFGHPSIPWLRFEVAEAFSHLEPGE